MNKSKQQDDELRELRLNLQHGDNATQAGLEKLREKLGENGKITGSDGEIFPLVDPQGNPTGLEAPRWLCHLLGLRHRSVHVLLKWHGAGMGDVFVLQIRSWQKSDSPGCVDISVGGHVVSTADSSTPEDTAYREMKEELGLDRKDLVEGQLFFKTGYESYDENVGANFHNAEWREVYVGSIGTPEFNKLRFNDREVVGLYLCPLTEAKPLLNQKVIPIASALRLSLPHCIS